VQAVLSGNLYRQTSLDVKTILHGTPDTAIDTIITHNSTGYAFFTYLANIVHVSSEPPNKGWTVKLQNRVGLRFCKDDGTIGEMMHTLEH